MDRASSRRCSGKTPPAAASRTPSRARFASTRRIALFPAAAAARVLTMHAVASLLPLRAPSPPKTSARIGPKRGVATRVVAVPARLLPRAPRGGAIKTSSSSSSSGDALRSKVDEAVQSWEDASEAASEAVQKSGEKVLSKVESAQSAVKRAGLAVLVAGALIAAAGALWDPIRYANYFVSPQDIALLSDVAKLGVATLVRFVGAANVVVATATASIIPDGAPQKMRRVVESSMLLYGLALVATAVIAQRGGLWTEAGKWLAQSYGGFIVFLFAFCLLSE